MAVKAVLIGVAVLVVVAINNSNCSDKYSNTAVTCIDNMKSNYYHCSITLENLVLVIIRIEVVITLVKVLLRIIIK